MLPFNLGVRQMPYIEDFSEFGQRMACEALQLKDVSFVFANGARSDGGWHHSEPPTDEAARLRLNHEFLRVKLERVTHRHNDPRDRVETQNEFFRSGWGNHPDDHFGPGWQEELKRRADEIAAVDKELAAAEAKLPAEVSDPFVALRKRRAWEKFEAAQVGTRIPDALPVSE
ncbi:MAG: hypothetical protein IH986_07980, partial [Planctomycetes bacterium]|nr:hypothetical protein [Planctomycetota bacterium]